MLKKSQCRPLFSTKPKSVTSCDRFYKNNAFITKAEYWCFGSFLFVFVVLFFFLLFFSHSCHKRHTLILLLTSICVIWWQELKLSYVTHHVFFLLLRECRLICFHFHFDILLPYLHINASALGVSIKPMTKAIWGFTSFPQRRKFQRRAWQTQKVTT